MPGQRAALAVLIAVEAAAFGYMSQTVVFPAAVVAAAMIGWRGTWRYRMSQDRQVILALVTALLFVVKWRVQPHSLFDDAMDYLSPFLHSLGQFLLVLQTAALYLEYDDGVLPITLPWPGVFVMISAGDVTIGRDSTQRFVFQLLALAFTCATAMFFSATARAASGTQQRPDGSGKLSVAAVLLAITVFIGGLSATALHRYENALNRLVSELLNPTMSSSSAGFPNRAQLGSVARRKSERSYDIALRVYSAGEPGYLRGKAYHWLTTTHGHFGETTQWEEAPPHVSEPASSRQTEEALEPVGTEQTRFRFDLRQPPGGDFAVRQSLDIWLEAPQWGNYFLPPYAFEVLSNEELIRRDYRQVTSGTDAGTVMYTVRIGSQTDLTAPQESPLVPIATSDEAPPSRGDLTFVPDTPTTAGSDPKVRAIADAIFRDCRTVDQHIVAVEKYFQSNYGYAVGIDPPSGQDPLRWFLTARPNAHCEYFAQAAAFLLRLRGIPTRYMTGFVAAERNEYGDYWLARNEHAHAWCEAWDAERGWVVVEATPAAGLPSERTAPRHRQIWEYLSGLVNQFRYRFSEGGWGWLVRQAFAFLATPAGWCMIAVVIAYVVIRYRMRHTVTPGPMISAEIREMKQLLRRMDARLERAGLIRGPGETLSRFADRVATESGDDAAAAWYVDYARVRYGGPDAESIAVLRTRLATLGPPPKPQRSPVATAAG